MKLKVEHHVYVHFVTPLVVKTDAAPTDLSAINLKLDAILMKLSEALTIISSAKTKLDEAHTEILAKIAELQSSDPDISPEGVASIEAIAAIATALADVVPNTPTPPEA